MRITTMPVVPMATQLEIPCGVIQRLETLQFQFQSKNSNVVPSRNRRRWFIDENGMMERVRNPSIVAAESALEAFQVCFKPFSPQRCLC